MPEYFYVGTDALIARAMEAVAGAVTRSADLYTDKAKAAETAIVSGELNAGIHVAGVERASRSVTAIVSTSGPHGGVVATSVHEGHLPKGTHIIAAYPGGLRFMEGPLIEHVPTHRRLLQEAVDEVF